MEVFIRNLDPEATGEQIEEWLTPILTQVGIHVFRLDKKGSKPYANLIVPDATRATVFIQKANSLPGLPLHPHTKRPASFVQSRHQLDSFEIKVLRKQEREFNLRGASPKLSTKDRGRSAHQQSTAKAIKVESVECGRWEVWDGQRYFTSFLKLQKQAVLTKKRRSFALKIGKPQQGALSEIVFDYEFIESLYLSRVQNQYCLIATLYYAPKIYNSLRDGRTIQSEFSSLLKDLIIDDKSQRIRSSKLPIADDHVSGTCLVYRFIFVEGMWKDDLFKAIMSLTSQYFEIIVENHCLIRQPSEGFAGQIRRLERAIEASQFSYKAKYQIEALWRNALLSPNEVQNLLPDLVIIRNGASNDHRLLTALNYLHTQLPMAGPETSLSESGMNKAHSILSQRLGSMRTGEQESKNEQIAIHRVMITPTGTYLYGPNKEMPNRVVRQFKGYEDHFLRVSFAEESGDKVQFDAEASNDEILRGRFLHFLRNGLSIAGEKFDFLGFSHSSLRSQSCWFMRQLVRRGAVFTARSVIEGLGNFNHIRCPAKCAARIGQAFSDTEKAVTIEPKDVLRIKDIESGEYIFTDGCGTISRSLCKSLGKGSLWHGQPTLFQIRYQGAKGMVSVDSRLTGRQMCLRPSMVKFEGSPSNDIEICGTNARPLPCRLNRPLIKILEDLGVPHETFEVLQSIAVGQLKRSAQSASSATDFLRSNFSYNPTGLAPLITYLAKVGIDVIEDGFVRSIIRSLIEVQLRDLKFRTRIPISQGVTLYGICDETGFLKEGQVYVTFETTDDPHSCLEGRIAVTRSPALHPGDVQLVTAVAAPAGSPLMHLTNCVVFSSRGARDVPSMLGGGDLDGDLFNVLYDKDLVPHRYSRPADYTPVTPVDIGRPVTTYDITEFFINFMENDQLGRIATNHMVFADQSDNGTLSANCLKLAALHSNAVDFSKSGRPVHWKNVPQPKPYRPDFMAPSASSRIERDKMKAAETAGDEYARYTYYKSDHILGKLYRAINEDEFFGNLENDDNSIFNRDENDTVLAKVWTFVCNSLTKQSWTAYLGIAQEVKDFYCNMLLSIMSQYAMGFTQTLTEREVIIGTIIGRSGSGNKRQREQSELMKASYKRELQGIRQWMKDQTKEDPEGYLSLAVACLYLGVGTEREIQNHFGAHLKSFAWFAAAICVPKVLEAQEGQGEV